MNPNCIYDVHTHWEWFRLDKGAYQDYLDGNLWITRKPETQIRPKRDSGFACNVSAEALALREKANRTSVCNILLGSFSAISVEVPYKDRMKETSIEELCLSVRSYHCLMRAGITNFGKLYEAISRENGLRGIRNLGLKSEEEIKTNFFVACYQLLGENEKAIWWQKVIEKSQTEKDSFQNIVQ